MQLDKDYLPPESRPKLLILISGKRKCGKDFLTDLITQRLNAEEIGHAVLRIAEPIKYYYAKEHSLDFERMLTASAYKEQHRLGLQNWSMEARAASYGCLCYEAIRMANAEGKPIWICADIRDRRDYKWFLQYYPDLVKRVRIQADVNVRKERGFVWLDTIDDGESECDLDHITDWDLLITNNGGSGEGLDPAVSQILSWIHRALE